MKLLVIGGGSIGKRHLTNFKQLGVDHLAVVDPREDRRREVAERVGVTAGYPDLDAALSADKFDAGVVGTPTAYKTDAAARCSTRATPWTWPAGCSARFATSPA
jgi:predicted dehydrogenase